MKNKKNLLFIPTLVFVILATATFSDEISKVVSILRSSDPQLLKQFLQNYGKSAALVSSLTMILQAIIAPLPAFIITVANGLLFGWVLGSLISLLSATLAAILCFEIARFFGKTRIEMWLGQKSLEKSNQFINKYGTTSIVIARFIPFVPFDPISYLMGLSNMRRLNFLMANLIGQLPATLFYAVMGDQILKRFY